MKTSFRDSRSHPFAVALTIGILALSCNKMPSEPGQGSLSWRFNSGIPTRSTIDIPDTDAFILKVTNSASETIYLGPYGRSPESILVNPGTYTVRAVSREFDKPEFEAPQFGDEQVVVVTAGSSTKVNLDCSQLNCGLFLKAGTGFKETYPSGSLSVSSADGVLDYATGGKGTGYFKPGLVTVRLDDGSGPKPILSRLLEARQMLSLGIACPEQSASDGGITINVDTLRIWDDEEFVIGSGADAGVTPEKAYGTAAIREHAGEKGVWVAGYIVGGDLSSSKNGIKFEPPFSSMTNIAMSARASVSEKNSCIAVQLTKGRFRDVLNLVEHPDLLGKKVFIKGDLESSYYGLPAIKNISDLNFCHEDEN